MEVKELFQQLSEIAEIKTIGDEIRLRPRTPELRQRVQELVERLRPFKKDFLLFLEEKQRKQFEVALDRLASEFPAPPKEVESLSEEQRERFAIMTVCGGLIDEAALKWIH